MQEQLDIFNELKEIVIRQLQEQNYLESTLTNYQRFYNRVERFMVKHGIAEYSHDVGIAFLEGLHSSKDYRYTSSTALACAIRRLNDALEGKDYRCHHGNEHEIVDTQYEKLLMAFLNQCRADGNKDGTIYSKQRWCTTFLNKLISNKCTCISDLSSDLVARTCLCFENKDAYAVIRLFLRFLYSENYIIKDLSGIVPKSKRPKIIPCTYSIDEMRRLEDSVDTSTVTGQRNISILLLATRIGLRAGDIARLRYDEIKFKSNEISLLQHKTGTALSIRIPDELRSSLVVHIENKRYGDGYVFHSFSAPYERISTSIIRHIVKEQLVIAEIDYTEKKHGPHAFRSSIATSMVNDDIPYETIRKVLGHTDPDVIKHYAKVDIKHLRECAIAAPVAEGLFLDFLCGRRSR